MLATLDGFFWVIAAIVLLLFLQRALHREIQAIFLILTRDPNITILAFSLLFLPGVFLHELSHLVLARLLGVRTGKFSLIPTVLPDGRLQLGYVEAAHSDIVRDSLVGVAPLISGILFVAYVAIERLQLVVLWDTLRNGQWTLFAMGLRILPTLPDFWLWFYLTFAVSSTMMPSESDRHAWLPFGIVSAVLFGLVLLAGAGQWMLENIAPGLNEFLRGTALILLVSILVHLVLMVPLLLLHRLLTRLTGLDVG
ncbi:MAG: hypothetical protein DDG60_01930 [Anaerolineae bacterium]|nr:MAG: hypothetical protein DDG60_01930 [Anaerolineae bacterium]